MKLGFSLLVIIGGIYASIYFYRNLGDVGEEAFLSPLPDRVEVSAAETDDRIIRLESFLGRYQSPLAPFAAVFIEAADKYGLDWRLLPAIAGVESTLGLHTPSCASYNPFGWKSYTSPCGYWRFTSFEGAIFHVADRLAHFEAYSAWRVSGEPAKLAWVYNRADPEFWLGKVNYFMKELE